MREIFYYSLKFPKRSFSKTLADLLEDQLFNKPSIQHWIENIEKKPFGDMKLIIEREPTKEPKQ